MVMGEFDVFMVRRGYTGGEDGVGGCVRSKPFLLLKSQKLEGFPTTVVFLADVPIAKKDQKSCWGFSGISRALVTMREWVTR